MAMLGWQKRAWEDAGNTSQVSANVGEAYVARWSSSVPLALGFRSIVRRLS